MIHVRTILYSIAVGGGIGALLMELAILRGH